MHAEQPRPLPSLTRTVTEREKQKSFVVIEESRETKPGRAAKATTNGNPSSPLRGEAQPDDTPAAEAEEEEEEEDGKFDIDE